jgi:hypothetical protein
MHSASRFSGLVPDPLQQRPGDKPQWTQWLCVIDSTNLHTLISFEYRAVFSKDNRGNNRAVAPDPETRHIRPPN